MRGESHCPVVWLVYEVATFAKDQPGVNSIYRFFETTNPRRVWNVTLEVIYTEVGSVASDLQNETSHLWRDIIARAFGIVTAVRRH